MKTFYPQKTISCSGAKWRVLQKVYIGEIFFKKLVLAIDFASGKKSWATDSFFEGK